MGKMKDIFIDQQNTIQTMIDEQRLISEWFEYEEKNKEFKIQSDEANS